MSSKTNNKSIAVFSEESRQQGQKALTSVSIWMMVYQSTTIASVSTLFLISLGADPFAVGLLSTFLAIGSFGQLLGLKLLPKTGKIRLLSVCFYIAMVPLGGLVVLALTGWTGKAAICVALIGYSVTVFLRMTGATGWLPLLQDTTAGDAIGSFFARLGVRLRLVEIFVPLLVGVYLGRNPGSTRFALPIAIGVLATALGNLSLRKAPERHVAPPSVGLLLRLRLAGRGKSVRRYIFFDMLSFFYIGLITPFWVVILKQHGMSELFLVAMLPFGALGHMIGLRLWSKIIDSYNYRPVLELSFAIMALLGLGWLVIPPAVQANGEQSLNLLGMLSIPISEIPLIIWGTVFYLIWGFGQGGWIMGQIKAAFGTFPEVYQADGFTLCTLFDTTAVATGSFIGGICFKFLTDNPTTFLGFDLRVIYLGMIQLCMLTILIAAGRLTDHHRQTSSGQLLATLWRRRIIR